MDDGLNMSLLLVNKGHSNFNFRLKFQLKSGTRFMNGVQMTSKAMTSVAGYMLQDDTFIGSLTVREHLTFLVGANF